MADAQKTESQHQEAYAKEEPGILEKLLSRVNVQPPKEAISLDEAVRGEMAGGRLSFAINHLIKAVAELGEKPEVLDKVLVDGIISRIDKKISNQVNEIMHNEKFREIESAWTGLKYAVDKTNFRKNIKMEISKQ